MTKFRNFSRSKVSCLTSGHSSTVLSRVGNGRGWSVQFTTGSFALQKQRFSGRKQENLQLLHCESAQSYLNFDTPSRPKHRARQANAIKIRFDSNHAFFPDLIGYLLETDTTGIFTPDCYLKKYEMPYDIVLESGAYFFFFFFSVFFLAFQFRGHKFVDFLRFPVDTSLLSHTISDLVWPMTTNLFPYD